ncbi:LOW QUALITY PROTEIN: Protein kinase [Phytophthora palmivora]|uniref:Protein kinase n=1 Tax=Phytophthora palmivora TaxID=4796 RepID=A0A2P4Y3A8_9STRA|nr:LOW QUALITY PROTEIN: Protein kinase [Phytophthora palmivora]
MEENEQRLTIMRDSLLTESVCDGEPMVILKSTSIPANGACLEAQSKYNLSCSCLSGFTNTTAWDFRIRAPDTKPISPFLTKISGGNVIRADSLMLLDIPSSLLTFKIHGDSNNLVPISIEKATTGDDDLAIVRSQEVSSLEKQLGEQQFYFVSNPIAAISKPSKAYWCHQLDNYCRLIFFSCLISDLSGNPIMNLTVTSDVLAIISQLSAFQIDTKVESESSCDSGEWRKVHNTNFCVVNSTSNSSPEVAVGDDSIGGNNTNWTIFVLPSEDALWAFCYFSALQNLSGISKNAETKLDHLHLLFKMSKPRVRWSKLSRLRQSTTRFIRHCMQIYSKTGPLCRSD